LVGYALMIFCRLNELPPKRDETKEIGRGGLDDFPDINIHAVGQYFELIDQGKIDGAEPEMALNLLLETRAAILSDGM